MSIEKAITAAAKKDYNQFEKAISGDVEAKMKEYLSGFQTYLTKNAFNAFKKKEE